MKGLDNLRKATPLLVLGIIAAIGLASAALLNYYGKVVGTATVSQSVQVSKDGQQWLTCTNVTGEGCTIEDQLSGVAGNVIYGEYYIKNNANNPVTIAIDDTDTPAEVEELKVDVVPLDINCQDTTLYYQSILGDSGPYITSIPSETPMKICEYVRFKINTLASIYNITLNIAPYQLQQ